MCKCLNKFERSRRQFLRTASLASMSGLYASPFILGLNSLAAMAQGTGSSDYKALVCVFLQGGNAGFVPCVEQAEAQSDQAIQ